MKKKALTLFFQYLFVVARPVFQGDAQDVYPGGHRAHVDAFQTVWFGADQTACKVIQFNALGLSAVIEAEGQMVFHGVGVEDEGKRGVIRVFECGVVAVVDDENFKY